MSSDDANRILGRPFHRVMVDDDQDLPPDTSKPLCESCGHFQVRHLSVFADGCTEPGCACLGWVKT